MDKIRDLGEIYVPLSECEYLYDDVTGESGHIDPNALSAGGFPWLLRSVLRYISNEDKQIEVKNLAQGDHQLWSQYRVELIRELEEAALTGKDVGPFTNEILKNMLKFGEYYVSNLDVPESGDFSDYKVPYEADLGYLVKYFLEKSNPNITVKIWNDLHNNSGLFSLAPLDVLFVKLGKQKLKVAYKVLVHGKSVETSVGVKISIEGTEFPNLEYVKSRPGILRLSLSDKNAVELDGVFDTEHTLTDSFNQYAYLYEHFPKDKINLSNPSQKTMYLSSVLNAKSCFFRVYEEGEKKYALNVKYPETFINQWPNWNIEKLGCIVKEGGWCSTGGKQVYFSFDENQVKNLATKMVSAVYQKNIISPFIKMDGKILFGHVRNLAILNKDGEVHNLGYLLKLTDTFNSSRYLTAILYFDPKGNYVYGVEDSNTNKEIPDLGGKVKLIYTLQKMKKIFSDSYKNWLVGMLYMNDFCRRFEFKNRINDMIENRTIDTRYRIS